jgi:hypothetical protein
MVDMFDMTEKVIGSLWVSFVAKPGQGAMSMVRRDLRS